MCPKSELLVHRADIPKVNLTFSPPRINGVTPSIKRVSAHYPNEALTASPDCASVMPDGSGLRVEGGPIFGRDEKRRSHDLKLSPVPARQEP